MNVAVFLAACLASVGADSPTPPAEPAAASVQSKADEAAIRELGQIWQDSWNRRDAAGLASIMDTDLVFVSVLGPNTPGFGRGGRAAFEAGHAALFKAMFADSRWITEDVTVVRWLRPDIAIAHVVWRTTGDRVRHIRHGDPRYGMFTWVVEKQEGRWRVVASQNTEAMPPLAGQ